MIKDAGTIPVTHFTCIGNTAEGIKDQCKLSDNGVDHMLALRSDLPFGWTGTGGDFAYATDLLLMFVKNSAIKSKSQLQVLLKDIFPAAA